MTVLRHTLSREEASNYPSPDFLGRFPVGFVSIVASKPGTGKTWYMLYNLCKYSFEGNVGAVIGDCAPELVYDRVRRITNDIVNDNTYVYFLSDLQQQGYGIDLCTKEGMDNLEKLVQQYEIKMLYLDTLISLMTADESSQKEMTPIMVRLTGIASQHKCAIIINHHLRKGGIKGEKAGEDIDEVIGSSILTRLASTVLTLKKQGMTETKITCVKNWFADSSPMIFRIADNNGALTMIETDVSNTTQQGGRSRAIKDYIDSLSAGSLVSMQDIIKMFPNTSMSTFRGVIQTFEATGKLINRVGEERFPDRVYTVA